MTKTEHNTTLTCEYCDRKIGYGKEIITVERAVLGPRGIIPLGELCNFCSEECTGAYFSNDPRKTLDVVSPRIT